MRRLNPESEPFSVLDILSMLSQGNCVAGQRVQSTACQHFSAVLPSPCSGGLGTSPTQQQPCLHLLGHTPTPFPSCHCCISGLTIVPPAPLLHHPFLPVSRDHFKKASSYQEVVWALQSPLLQASPQSLHESPQAPWSCFLVPQVLAAATILNKYLFLKFI